MQMKILFMKENIKSPILINQIQEFNQKHLMSNEEINDKFKKTYKNRCFIHNKYKS